MALDHICMVLKVISIMYLVYIGTLNGGCYGKGLRDKDFSCNADGRGNNSVTRDVIRLAANTKQQVIISPDNPKSPNNLAMTWIIRAKPGSHVELVIENGKTEECCDYIEIRDGPNSKSPLLAIKRGRMFLHRFISVKRFLFVKYVTDESVHSEGFRAVYNVASTSEEDCSEDYFADGTVRKFISPNWPTTYSNNLFCTWTIRAPRNQHVQLNITEFFTSGGDALLVQDGDLSWSPYIARLTGWQPPGKLSYNSFGQVLVVHFISDKQHVGKGFSATYSAGNFVATRKKSRDKRKKCGDNIRLPKHIHRKIFSPNWPDVYPASMDCVWILNAERHGTVKLYFLYVNTGWRDFVVVRDGCSSVSEKLGSINQETKFVKLFQSTGSVMRIEFKTQQMWPSPPEHNGFHVIAARSHVSFTQVSCRRHRLITRKKIKYLSSDEWPKTYEFQQNCSWEITSGNKKRVHFHVVYLSTEKCCDYLEIIDGPNISKKKGTRISGQHQTSFTYVSTGAVLSVRFVMDTSVGYSGFLAYFRDQEKDEERLWDVPANECESVTCL